MLKVLGVIELAQKELHALTHPPSAVDLHLSIGPSEVAGLLRRVVELMRRAFAGISVSEFEDIRLGTELGVHVLKRFITASDAACTRGCLEHDVVLEMQEALSISNGSEVVTLAHSQFLMFLDVFCEEEAVAAVFEDLGLPQGKDGLRQLRAGRGFLNLSVHPLIAYLHQLQQANPENFDTRYETCLESMAIHRKLATAISDKYFDVSVDTLDQTLEGLSQGSLVLPSFLHTALLCDRYGYACLTITQAVESHSLPRASICFHRGQVEEAAADCDAALALDARNDKAYSLRAECRAAAGDLSGAAEDAMSAFVLTGSADMALASTAELACREVCRSLAKDEFAVRCTRLTNENAIDDSEELILPKEWFARSYLAGYEGFMTAYNLDFSICHNVAIEAGIEKPCDSESRPSCDVEVPQHLRDLDATELRQHDEAAYRLLCKAAYLIDKIYCKGSAGVIDVDELLAQQMSSDEGTDINIQALSRAEIEDLLSEHERHRVSLEQYRHTAHLAPNADYNDEPSMELRTLFSMLRTEDAVAMSGVHWSSRGHISSVEVQDPYFDIDDSVAEISEPVEYTPLISPQLLARLMNLSASIAYFCGDTNGAMKCLRYSCYLDRRLTDSFIKLGSLLVDVDEVDEAEELLRLAVGQDPLNPFAYMHTAELNMHQNEFHAALESLQRANQLANHRSVQRKGDSVVEEAKAKQDEFRAMELSSNIKALLAVAQFRADPSDPEVLVLRELNLY